MKYERVILGRDKRHDERRWVGEEVAVGGQRPLGRAGVRSR